MSLEAIEFVDEVLIFESEEQLKSLRDQLNPDCLVKGGEWTAEEVRTRDQVAQSTAIKIYPQVDNYSTTNTLKKVKDIDTWEKS